MKILLVVLALGLLCGRVLAAPATASFNDSGLNSLQVAGQERLVSGTPTIWRGSTKSGAPLNLKVVAATFEKAARRYEAQFDWGAMQSVCELLPDGVRLRVTVSNKGQETISGLNFNLLSLASLGENQKIGRPTFGVEGPSMVLASGPNGSLAYAAQEDGKPLMLQLEAGADSRTKAPVVNVRANLGGERVILDGVTAARPLAPGQSETFSVTLRLGAPGESALALAQNEIDAYRKTHPQKLNWPDRRPILRLFFGGGLPKAQADANLREPDKATFPAPDAKLAAHVASRMKSVIEAAKNTGAQGVIIWDLEGDAYPHPLTYVGDPRLIRLLNPQMDSLIDDAFQTLREAGLRVGMTLRPSRVVYSEAKKSATHMHSGVEPFAELDAKVAYAKQRWNATLFYVDTNFFWRPYGEKQEWQSGQLTPQLWEKLQAKYPDTLFIPEFGNPADFPFTAPYGEADMGQYGTPELVRALWPESWRVIVIEDADPYQNFDRFVATVRERNALMAYAYSPDLPAVVAMTRIQREARLLDAPVPPAVREASPTTLSSLLNSPDAAVRFHAARRLAEATLPAAAEALLARAQDAKEEFVVRRAAILALAKNPAPTAVAPLADLLLDRKSGLYAAASLALAAQGQAAQEPLLARLETQATAPGAGPGSVETLCDAIAVLGRPAAAPRVEAIYAKVPESRNAPAVRRALLRLVGQLKNPQSEAFLMAAFAQSDLREAAATALVRLGTASALAPVKAAHEEARKNGDKAALELLNRALQTK